RPSFEGANRKRPRPHPLPSMGRGYEGLASPELVEGPPSRSWRGVTARPARAAPSTTVSGKPKIQRDGGSQRESPGLQSANPQGRLRSRPMANCPAARSKRSPLSGQQEFYPLQVAEERETLLVPLPIG